MVFRDDVRRGRVPSVPDRRMLHQAELGGLRGVVHDGDLRHRGVFVLRAVPWQRIQERGTRLPRLVQRIHVRI